MASIVSSGFNERLQSAFHDRETLSATCQEIASEIESKQRNLFAFVEELGSFVTDKDASVREKGIDAFSIVLTYLPKDFLNQSELNFITTFYCDRLKDHHSIIPVVLKGILALVQMHNLPPDAPSRLFRVMFEHVQCQSQLLPERRNIYFIFATLLQNRIDDLKVMGPDLVYGIISAIDGERDPRNLILLFNILPQFIKEFLVDHLVEEMFEVIACYFPVDFNPSAADGLGITRDDLAERLAPCLCIIPQFGQFCMPLITEKLFSSLKVAKMDSLNLLCKGAPIFGPQGLEPHLQDLWVAFEKELIQGGENTELKSASLKAIKTVIEVLSEDEELHKKFVELIIKSASKFLWDVQFSLFKPTEKLFEHVAMVNKQSCIEVLRVVISMCLRQYSSKTMIADKIVLLETINNFIKISFDHGLNIKSMPELSWTDILQLYLKELSSGDAELKSTILLGLTAQITYLSDVHRAPLYDEIFSLIQTGSVQIREACHTCILSLATLHTSEVSALIKERLKATDDENIEMQARKIEALSAVAKTRQLGSQVIPEIVSKINSTNYEISLTALRCLHRLVAIKNDDFDVQHYLHNECNIIQKLISLDINHNDQRLDLMSKICRLVVKSLTLEKQKDLVTRYSAVLSSKIPEINVVLVISLFISLRENVDPRLSQDTLENLYNLAIYNTDSNIRQTTCKFIAVVMNKMTDDDQSFPRILSFFMDKLNQDFGLITDVDVPRATIILRLWLTKAMVAKGHRDAEIYLNNLASILKHDREGEFIAREYNILMDKHEDALTEENFCNVRIFYKQRIFEHAIQRSPEFENTSRRNYLTALVRLLKQLPMELLFMHLTKLAPLLIESLSLDNEQLVFSTLSTLQFLLDNKHIVFSEKEQCFIPRLLKLSTHRSMRVRVSAIECLNSYCNYSTILINKYKQDVLEKLASTIDDRKRLVRKAAVKARTRWYLVGAPGGIKDQ